MHAYGESEAARDATVQDLTGAPGEYAPTLIVWGVAGWADDPNEPVEDLGTTENDGRTLVRVTLYKGKWPGREVKPNVAQGHEVLAQVLGPFFAIPPKGTQVCIAFPDGDTETHGNGVIIGWAQSTASISQFSATRAVIDMGAQTDLVLKGRSITLMDHGKDETPSRFACWLTVGPVAGGAPTVSCNDPTGSGWTVGNGVVGLFATDGASPPAAKAFLQLKKDKVGLGINGSTLIKCDDQGNATVGCSKALALVGAQVLVGAAATPVTAACVTTPSGSGATGTGSTCVFISP